MPKARLTIHLDNPRDYFEILNGAEKFGGIKARLKVKGNELSLDVDAEDAKSVVLAIGSIVKQIRIIEEASAAIGKK
ncbi:MAG: hypothetical protein KGH64_02085 [Candidatus Micrarchaeota archaeon]|nr:hypothetical protein [Candidatus Micrarchaeota archaeon]MDE1834106.1 hypothetical protein [Candidatus Micrarchaeota archaeon]MDE1859342.1 hypothetical protein [Candidatus Micrarchaeota archaeon]